MNRNELDAVAAHHRLSPEAIEAMLALAHARPDSAELGRFVAKLMQLAGVLSLAAGVVFLVAANWDAFAVAGRFALVESIFALAIGLALWRPPPHALGRYALLGAFIAAGALLALFGQTYQTGADVYELFLTWTLLGLPLVLAAQWSVALAAWALVLNVALLLFCGFRPEAGLLWIALGAFGLDLPQLLIIAMIVDLALWLAGLAAARTRWSHVAPQWLCRFVLAGAVAFGTWAGFVAIADFGFDDSADGLVVLIVLGMLAGVVVHTLRQRVDVFPLAAIAASLIVLSSTAIARYASFDDVGTFFTLAAWLIASSAVSGHFLMKAVRAWRIER
jgi:uncharacterized membrane protein